MGIRIRPNSAVFDVSGSWTVPLDVDQVEAELWGAGAGIGGPAAGGDAVVSRGATNLALAPGGNSPTAAIGDEIIQGSPAGLLVPAGSFTGARYVGGSAPKGGMGGYRWDNNWGVPGPGTKPGGGAGIYIGDASQPGNGGSYVRSVLSVNPGEVLTVSVPVAPSGGGTQGRVVIRYWTHVFA